MDNALIKLLVKKPFEYITVKELCTEAGVNRSTFYLHYENTDDLLAETAEKLVEKFLSYFDVDAKEEVNSILVKPTEELIFIKPEYVIPYLEFMRDNRKVFAVAMKNHEKFNFHGKYKSLFEYVFNPILERFRYPEKERKYVMTFYLTGINSIVTSWMEGECAESPEEIAAVIKNCIFGRQ